MQQAIKLIQIQSWLTVCTSLFTVHISQPDIIDNDTFFDSDRSLLIAFSAKINDTVSDMHYT